MKNYISKRWFNDCDAHQKSIRDGHGINCQDRTTCDDCPYSQMWQEYESNGILKPSQDPLPRGWKL